MRSYRFGRYAIIITVSRGNLLKITGKDVNKMTLTCYYHTVDHNNQEYRGTPTNEVEHHLETYIKPSESKKKGE